jgi:hypothetical protein
VEQASKHDMKQDNVGNERDKDTGFGALRVKNFAVGLLSFPRGSELRMDKPRGRHRS